VPMLPGSLLRRIARLGGVHEYIQTEDVVWASRQMLAVSVHQPGLRKIVLPRAATVRDLYTGQEVARSAGAFEVRFDPRSTRVFLIDSHDLSFVPEMERIPEMDVPITPARWSGVEKAKVAEDVSRAKAEWRKRIPEIQGQLAPDRVRSLSRWAKTQMEQYKAVPALETVKLKPLGTDSRQETLVLEGPIDPLPSHSPLVPRWLKVYLFYDLRGKLVSRVTITIRGRRLE